jgi:hypothetical protein
LRTAFGPSVVNGHFFHYSYIYYLGQMAGALIATFFCSLLLLLSTEPPLTPNFLDVILKAANYNEGVGDIDSAKTDRSAEVRDGPMGSALHKVIPFRNPEDDEEQNLESGNEGRSLSGSTAGGQKEQDDHLQVRGKL